MVNNLNYLLNLIENIKGLDFNETFHSFKKNDTIINDTPEALRDFYKSHYLYYFSINGIFEDEIYIPIFDVNLIYFSQLTFFITLFEGCYFANNEKGVYTAETKIFTHTIRVI